MVAFLGPLILKTLLPPPISLHSIRVGGKPALLGNFPPRIPIMPPVIPPRDTPPMMDWWVITNTPPPVPTKEPEVSPHLPGFSKGRSCNATSSELPRASDSKVIFHSDIPASDDNSDDWVSNDSSNASTSSGKAFNKRVHDYYNHSLIAPEQKFDFIDHLSSIVLLLKQSNTTAVYEALVDTHLRDCQLQIALIRILIYIINNDYFITTGLSMLALQELQATILSNLHVNHAMRCVAQGGDLHFPLEPLDSLLMVAVPPVPSLGPPPVPFYMHPSRKQSPHVSGTASDDIMSLDQSQTLGTTLDQTGVPKPKTKMQLQRDYHRRALDSNCP